MYQRLAAQIQEQLPVLLDQYDARLSQVPGYAALPEPTRRDLEKQVLLTMVLSLEAGDDQALIEYIHARAEQVLARGFQPEWFQQAVTVAEEVVTPLIATVDEGQFVWQAMSHAQTTAWQIVARERRRVEEALRTSEAQYRQAITAAGAVPYYLDYTTETYRFIGDGIGNLLGYPVAEVTPTLLGQLIQETIMTGEDNALLRESAIQQTRAGNLSSWNADYRLTDRNGQTVWLHDSSIQILDEDRKPIGAMGIMQDVTKRKLAEQQQQRTAAYLRATIEAAKELNQSPDLDALCRRTVELARDKFGVERCGLYLLAETGQHLVGTYGTDDQGRTTDEHGAWRTLNEFENLLIANTEQLWAARETPYTYFDGAAEHVLGRGWTASTVLRGVNRPIAILFNDQAISGLPVDNTQQEALAVYCSLVGSIMERKQSDEALRQSAVQQERTARYLRATIEASTELTQVSDMDTLCRRTVELAREKFDVERCGLYLLDASLEAMMGTFGTDDQGQTTDERGVRRPTSEFADLLAASTEQLWVTRETPQIYFEHEVEHTVGTGWAAATILRGASGPLAVMFNDRAISGQPVDTAQQEALAVYCSIVGSIIERKRIEDQVRESLLRRGVQVQTSIEVGQHIAAAPELDELFHRVVTLVKERFNYYHAQVFQHDPSKDTVELITGYGEVGQNMLKAGHKVAIGRGVVGTAAALGESVLASDVTLDRDWRPNPNLPSTKGELAVPIKLGSTDPVSQVNALKYYTTTGFDGVIVAAIDAAAVGAITQDALKHGIPIVAVSNPLGPDNQTAVIATDEFELGQLAGIQAGEWARQHLPGDSPVKLGMLTERSLPNVVERERGMIAGIQAVLGERVVVVDVQSVLEAKQAAYVTEGWLRTYPDLNMILAYNDANALGAYRAAENEGRHDPDRFFIGGVDGVPAALDAIQRGGVYQATVNQPPEVAGIMAVRTLVAAIKGLPVKPTYTLHCTPVNRANAAEYAGPNRLTAVLANQEIISAETFTGLDVSGLRLGLSVLTLANPFFAALTASAQQEARRLGIQLVINDPARVLGVLDVQSDAVGALTDEDRLLLEGLCGQIASAMESTRLLANAQQAERDMAKFKLGLDRSTTAIFITDIDGVITYVNPGFERVYGYTREEAIGQTPRILKSGLIPQEQYQHFWGALLAGQTVSGEIINKAKDGRLVPIEGSNTSIQDERGNIIGFLALHTDITERKQAEAKLQELLKSVQQSEQLMRTLIDTIPGHIYAKDLDGRLILANRAEARLHGLDTPETLLGKSDFDFYPRELAEQYWASEQQILHTGIPLLEHEEPNADVTGRSVWSSTTKVPLRDSQGDIIGLVGMTLDITERKRTEEELARSAQLLKTIINTSRDLIYVKDTQSRFLVASQGVARLIGVASPDELIGKNDYDFFPYELAHKYFTDEQQILERGEPLIDIEEEASYVDGTRIWMLTTKIPYRAADGTLQGIVGIGRDITERKRAEQRMEETLRETERLYAAVSHEGWQAYRQTGALPEGYVFDQALLQPTDQLWEPEMTEALEQQTQVASRSAQRAVTVSPLTARGETLGALGVYDDPAHPLSDEDRQLIDAVAEQVALALESARLFDQSQRDAEREFTINRVTSRIRNARSVDEVLSIAAQELRLATRASRSVVELRPDTGQSVRSGNGEGGKA